MWDVLSGVAEVAWDVLSGAAKMAWDVLSGVTKTAWDVLSGVANWCGMFCPGWQKMAWDVLSRDVLSYIRVFELGERVQKWIQRLSSLTCVTTILLRHDHAWIFGQRILLEMIAFYATVLVIFVNWNSRKRVTYCRLSAATCNSCAIHRSFDF